MTLYPLQLVLVDRPVLLVGGGAVARHKADALLAAGARVTVVAPAIDEELAGRVACVRARAFEETDLDGACLVVSAATPEVNRVVCAAAHARGLFVLAVDQPAAGSAHSPAIIRRGSLLLTISTDGVAPALSGLVREALEALLPDGDETERWLELARRARESWRAARVPHSRSRPLLLSALTALYEVRS